MKLHMDVKDQHIALAISGGVDSMVLFHLLTNIYTNYKSLTLLHVNHGIREESQQEEVYIRQLAESYGLPCVVEHLQFEGDFSQQKARDLRYAFYASTIDRLHIDMLLTGHHIDDDRETLIHQLFTNRIQQFNVGIPFMSTIQNISVIRPLLYRTKEELYRYAEHHSIRFFEDVSNQSTDYTRNYIRNVVIPTIDDSPHLDVASLDQLKQDLHDIHEILTDKCAHLITTDTIERKVFNQLKNVEKRYVLLGLFNEHSLSTKHMDEIIRVSESDTAQASYAATSRTLHIAYDKLFITKTHANSKSFTIDRPGIYTFNDYTIEVSDGAHFPLHVRTKEDGDSVPIHNGTKKVSRMFIDKKVSNHERDRMPIVEDKDREIIAIGTIYTIMDNNEKKKIRIERNPHNELT